MCMEKRRRQISAAGRGRISRAWTECLSNPQPPKPETAESKGGRTLEATRIHDCIMAEVEGQMKEEGLVLSFADRTRLSLEISALYIMLFLEEEGGLEKCLRKVENDLLNGWPFGEEAKKKPLERTLGQETRREIMALIETRDYPEAKTEAIAILASIMTVRGYFENEEDDREVNDVFNTLIERFDEMEIDELLARFEETVLNHPKLKNPGPPEPVQELLL